uniref:Uncharacterized protein n=1 Tax=Pyxicephalus adspersus TaxID=30357 RepID=A0AAV3B0E8_PYXAD|nr:TPA: hypothetical protein GDO54_006871 [Pyxicephalus adspersus]
MQYKYHGLRSLNHRGQYDSHTASTLNVGSIHVTLMTGFPIAFVFCTYVMCNAIKLHVVKESDMFLINTPFSKYDHNTNICYQQCLLLILAFCS